MKMPATFCNLYYALTHSEGPVKIFATVENFHVGDATHIEDGKVMVLVVGGEKPFAVTNDRLLHMNIDMPRHAVEAMCEEELGSALENQRLKQTKLE